MEAMQVIVPQSPSGPARPMVAILGGSVAAGVLLAVGVALGYLAFATTFVTQFSLTPRPGPGQVVAGVLGWAFAFTAPSVFFLVGIARIAAIFDTINRRRPRPTPVTRHASKLPDDFVAAARLRLPEGRRVPEVVLGPFGIAVIEQLPPSAATRHTGGRWEVRMSTGRWEPLENPLDRASRDAESIRRWIADGDRDFVVRVYAAVVAPDDSVPRTKTCAIVTPERIPAWLESLPPQRSMTATRRERLLELIQSAV
jgi:hypothetical protein